MTIQKIPRLAIIGCGAVIEYHFVPALRRIGWLPSVLIDISSKRLDVVARSMGGHGRTVLKASDWSAVAGEFDAAIVATPHALHGSLGTALAQAGKHIFMEKPLATTAVDCRSMIAAADKSNVVLSVGLLRRYLRIARWTKALLEQKILGEIKRFEAREGFIFNWNISSDAMLRPDMAGGGVLMDTGAHTLDLLLWWLGDVTSIDYRDDSEGGVEADCVLDCHLVSGASGRVELSRTRNLRNTVYIEGTEGFVEVHLYKNTVVAGSPNALAFKYDGITPADMKPQFFTELFDAELSDFRGYVTGASRTGVSGRDGVKSVELVERCYAARKPLTVPWAEGTSARLGEATSPLSKLPAGSNVLITGATGFIGGRLAERLVREHGAQVRCIVRSNGHATRLARLPVAITRVDFTNADDIERAMRGVDYVFHCAYDPRSRRQNLEGLHNLMQACVAHGVRRFVHVSTFSVYEPFPDGPLTEETSDGDKSWQYVDTKLELEKNVFEWARNQGLPATIVQPAIVYGPFCKPWTDAPAEMLIFGDVILPNCGNGLCNAVYIDDLTDGLVLAALSPAAIGQRFIMSGPRPVTWGTFFADFAKALGTAPPMFWPNERITKANHGIGRDLRLILSNPKKIMQIIVRWNLARRVLQRGLDAMPLQLRTFIMQRYYTDGGPQIGEVFLPDRQKLALYDAKASVTNEKARALLGYNPRVDFQTGMALTKLYLEWAFGDIIRAAATARNDQPRETAPSSLDVVNAK